MPAPSGPQRVAGAATLLLGAAWLALALPVAGAALARLPGDAVLRDLRAGQPVATGELERLLRSRQAAFAWRADSRDRADWALAQMLLAERAGHGRVPARLHAAERALTAALAAAPADPFAWTRLALVRWRLGRSPDSVHAALAAARTTGPHTQRLKHLQRALSDKLTGGPHD